VKSYEDGCKKVIKARPLGLTHEDLLITIELWRLQ